LFIGKFFALTFLFFFYATLMRLEMYAAGMPDFTHRRKTNMNTIIYTKHCLRKTAIIIFLIGVMLTKNNQLLMPIQIKITQRIFAKALFSKEGVTRETSKNL